MKIAVVLGNRINNDGSMTKTLIKRLELAINLLKDFNIDYMILSGGLANPTAKVTEACKMYDYLVEKGINKDKLIKEEKSLTTYQNAVYSWEIMSKYDVDTVLICSTFEHFNDKDYNTLGFFNSVINNEKIKLMIYTDCKKKEN